MTTDAWASASHRSSCSSSSDSATDAFDIRRRIIRLGFQRLELHELQEVREMQAATCCDAAAAVARGEESRVRTLEPLALPEPDNQERDGAKVVVRQVNGFRSHRFKAVLSAEASLCSVALLVYLGSTLWIRTKYRKLLRATTRRAYADDADLPLIPGCGQVAWQQCMAAIIDSVSKSKVLCDDLYSVVCDSWKHRHQLLSVADAPEDTMYKRALSAIKRATTNGSYTVEANSSTISFERKIAALARSCMELSESSLQDLKRFMAERCLPLPLKCRWHPLAIHLELSEKWNIHLWLQIDARLSPLHVRNTEPVLEIAPSPAFLSSLATTRAFVGHPTRSAPSLQYQRYARIMLHLFDVPDSSSGEVASTIMAMKELTLKTLGPAMTVREPRILRMSIRNLRETPTLRVPTRRLVMVFNDYHMSARHFSPSDFLEVENFTLLRPVVYMLGLSVEKRQSLTLGLGLRVVHELGWMANREITNITLEIVGLPPSAHTRRCLIEFERTVNTGWISLFPMRQECEPFIGDLRDALNAVARRSEVLVQLRVQSSGLSRNSDSFLDVVLPEPSRALHFVSSLNLTVRLWWLQEQNDTNVFKPASLLSHRWRFHGAFTVAGGHLVLPLYHLDLPPPVNYGGASRLVAGEVPRGLFHEPFTTKARIRTMKVMWNIFGIRTTTCRLTRHFTTWTRRLFSPSCLHTGWVSCRTQALPTPDCRDMHRAGFSSWHRATWHVLSSSSNDLDSSYGDARRRSHGASSSFHSFAAAFRCNVSLDKL